MDKTNNEHDVIEDEILKPQYCEDIVTEPLIKSQEIQQSETSFECDFPIESDKDSPDSQKFEDQLFPPAESQLSNEVIEEELVQNKVSEIVQKPPTFHNFDDSFNQSEPVGTLKEPFEVTGATEAHQAVEVCETKEIFDDNNQIDMN